MTKKSGKPFYFMVNSDDPHRPFFVPGEKLKGGMAKPSRIYSPDEIEVPGFLPDLPDVRKELSYYYNSTKRLDDTFGKVMQALDESGYRGNTLVIFMSDNGIAVPFAKCNNYHASSRTPWIVRWPGKVKPGAVDSTHFISGIDIMPTVLDITGLPYVPEMDGRSYLPLMYGESQEGREDVFTTYYQIFARIRYPMRTIQNDEFGYIYNFWADGETRMRGDAMGGLTWRAMVEAAETDENIADRVELYKYRVPEEFYDFKNDPDGLNNLIDDPEYADEIKILQERMIEVMEQYNDPALEAFKSRDKPGAIDEFMEQQRERAKNTKPVVRF